MNPSCYIKRTNKETVQWIKLNMGSDISTRKLHENAEVFFGKLPINYQQFSTWKDNILSEYKRKKMGAQRNLMKLCGGTGKNNVIPPNDYFPPNLYDIENENKCKV